jgi:argininosuccinate lyase
MKMRTLTMGTAALLACLPARIALPAPEGGAAALLTSEELKFLGSHDHRGHAAGEAAPVMLGKTAPKRPQAYYTAMTDRAWVVMLAKTGLVPRESAAKVLAALEGATAGGEDALKKRLKGNEDLASVVNYGRTLQEPMSRMLLRDHQLDVFDALLRAMRATLDASSAHAGTIMPGCTHMAHAQPTTYGAYLLASYDGLARSLEQLELAYRQTDECTAGCGATSGTGWPVDRQMVTDLLGFSTLMEPTYACEGAQDYGLTTMFALCNVMTVLSRTAMDHGIWGMEDCGLIRLPGRLLGLSSLMPQKAHPGSTFERIRINADKVIGHMTTGLIACKGEPLTDVLPIYEAWKQAANALAETEASLDRWADIIASVQPQKEKMLQHTRDGFSGAPDLAIELIREKGYGGRRAHRICAVFVYLARKQNLKPYEVTGALLDEAAKVANEAPPGLSTEKVREMLDPEKFLQRHTNVGDPHPDETRRLVDVRRKALDGMATHQSRRRERLAAAQAKLDADIAAIVDARK